MVQFLYSLLAAVIALVYYTDCYAYMCCFCYEYVIVLAVVGDVFMVGFAVVLVVVRVSHLVKVC